MKLRIQDNSVRFRITLKELEQLVRTGAIRSETQTPPEGSEAVFRYAVTVDQSLLQSRLHIAAFAFTLALSQPDFDELLKPSNEGVYVRNEWTDASGATRRFIVFIEKDRPASVCEKPEAWIYEERHCAAPSTRPISQKPADP